MGLLQIIGPEDQLTDARGQPLAGGKVYLYEPGTTTFITSYKDSGLVMPHTNPVKLSGSGRANIWISRNADMIIHDRNGSLVTQSLSANPDDLGSDGSGLVPNGSFEIDANADSIPDGWTLASEAGATNAIDTSESTDGAQGFRFTSSGVGGGSIVTDDYFPVNDVEPLRIDVDIRSTVAGVRNIVRVEWSDIALTPISDTDAYDSTATPATYTTLNLQAIPPANARFAKLRLIGVDPSVALAGSTFYDRCSVFYPAVVSGVFDNITVQNNQIVTTNLNGDLELAPNGNGSVNINQANAVDLTDTENGLNVGTDDPDNNPHIAFSPGIVQGKADQITPEQLEINPYGGDVLIGAVAPASTGGVALYKDAQIRLALGGTDGIGVYSAVVADPALAQDPTTLIYLLSAGGLTFGTIGYNGAAGVLRLENHAHGADIKIVGANLAGTPTDMLVADPDGVLSLTYAGRAAISTALAGATISGPPAAATVLDVVGTTGYDGIIRARSQNGGATFEARNGGSGRVSQTSAAGVYEANWLAFTRNGAVSLYFSGAQVVNTLAVASGGLEVNNTLTGAGFERVLTATDQEALRKTGTIVARSLAAASGGLEVNNTLTGAGFERVLTIADGTALDADIVTAQATADSKITAAQAAAEVTYANLNGNGDVGTGAAQVAKGDHTHSVVTAAIAHYSSKALATDSGSNVAYYSTLEEDTLDGLYGSVVNTAAAGLSFTADRDLLVTVSATIDTSNGGCAIILNGVKTDTPLTNTRASRMSLVSGGGTAWHSMVATFIMQNTDEVWVCYTSADVKANDKVIITALPIVAA